jgi:hypothetical protein
MRAVSPFSECAPHTRCRAECIQIGRCEASLRDYAIGRVFEMSTLAKDFAISDVALAKRCRAVDESPVAKCERIDAWSIPIGR